MKYIVVDLEMNPLSREYETERFICKDEIIEIGAVLLDEEFQEIGSFMTLVKPKYNDKIERKIEKLTGITFDMVQAAPYFGDAVDMFFQWCSSIPDEISFIQWSESDLKQLSGEMLLKSYIPSIKQEKFLDNWTDFQKEYGDTLGVDRQLSLQKALMYAGLDAEGKLHDALFDARNTGRLVRIVRTPDLCDNVLRHVINAIKPKPIEVALGSLFDFSKFNLPA